MIPNLISESGLRQVVSSNALERFIGGQRGTRTPDILLVRQAL
jgi:hypothetical protein